MAEESITITGLDELVEFLSVGAPRKLQDSIATALTDLADDIRSTTTSLVPVKTGALKNSISVVKTEDSINASVGMDYASYVDQGTSRMAAEPFFTEPVSRIMELGQQRILSKLESSGIFN
jgi:Bacteriophage HK97-gp10, putative tail-component